MGLFFESDHTLLKAYYRHEYSQCISGLLLGFNNWIQGYNNKNTRSMFQVEQKEVFEEHDINTTVGRQAQKWVQKIKEWI